MALINPPTMYSAGAVTFNTQPGVNLYAQTLLRKRAREEALDQYEINRLNRINETGLRDIDRQGLDERILDLRQYYGANRDLIRRGNNPASYEYERKIRDVLTGINKSKNATAVAESANKLRQERLRQGRNTPQEMFDDLVKMEEMPVWDEKYTPFDLTKYMAQSAPKYDAIKTLKSFENIKRSPLAPRFEEIPGDKYSRMQYIDEAYDKDAKITIAAKAHDLYDSDDGFAFEVQQDFNNPVKRGELEKIAIKEFGSAPQSMGDYAAAKIISQLQPTITGKPKMVPKYEERTRLQDELSRGRIRLAASLRTLAGMGALSVPQDLSKYNVGADNTTRDITELMGGNDIVVYPEAGEAYVSPIVYYNPNSGVFTYYNPVKNKTENKDYKTFMQDISALNPGKDMKEIWRLPFGNTTIGSEYLKQKPAPEPPKPEGNIRPKPTSSSYLIKGIRYTEKELLKMGYTLDQIKPYKQ